MPNVYERVAGTFDGLRVSRLGEQSGADRLGLSVYELDPGQGMVFHYHLQREELLIVLSGRVSLRTWESRRDLEPGDVVSFPRGEAGAHAYESVGTETARVLVASEQNAPNVSVYPDAAEIGIFDAAHRADRRFGALFRLEDAVSGYGGGEPRPRGR